MKTFWVTRDGQGGYAPDKVFIWRYHNNASFHRDDNWISGQGTSLSMRHDVFVDLTGMVIDYGEKKKVRLMLR